MRMIRRVIATTYLHGLTAYTVIFHPYGQQRSWDLYNEVLQGIYLSGVADAMLGFGRRRH